MSPASEAITTQISGSVRRLLRQVLGQEEAPVAAPLRPADPSVRWSKGLREFSSAIRSPEGLQILDLGAASQANINFLTGLGHRLCTEDLYRALQFTSARRQPVEDPAAEERAEEERFFRENLRYRDGQFDGVLCWDLLDLLPDAVVKPLVRSLHRLTKPGGNLLTFFHTGQPGQAVPVCQYRIVSEDRLQITERRMGKLRRSFNNRAIEGLFRDYTSLKFYLTRDSLREVVIVR